MLLLISPFVSSIHGGQGDTETDTRAGDYANFGEYGLGNHYIGEAVEFRIIVYNNYDGQHWIGDPYQYSHDTLYDVKLDIQYDELRMQDGTPASGTITATTPTSLTPYNGDTSQGFTISGQRTYYSSSDNDNFEFKISTLNVKHGYYELPLKITANVQVDTSATDPSGYSWASITEYGYVTFMIRSNLQGLSTENNLNPYESGYVPLYAGSTYMTVRGPSIYPQTYGITDLDIELTLPGEDFNVQVPTFHVDDFMGSAYPAWKIEVYEDTPPGEYTGNMVCTYSRGGENYIEGPYNATVSVAETPLLMPPDTEDMTDPTLVTTQKTDSLTFAFEMVNKGNVDLESVLVRLDLDRSTFLSQLEFYYNEDDYSSKVYTPLEYETEDVGVGEVISVVFPTVSVYGMLPPGDYMIPIDYKITYKDPAQDSLTATRIDSYQWDELYMNDYLETMFYREDPRPTDLKKPHFMMRVLDDTDGADIKVDCNQVFGSGSKNLPVTFTLLNKEFYSIRNAEVEIRSSNPAMVWSSMHPGDTSLLANEEDITIPSSGYGNPGTVNINGMIDISGECPTGKFEIELIITGLDEVGNQVQINRTESIDMKAEPGRLTVASVSTGSVEPGKDFTMKVNLMNSGDVTISEYQVMLQCSDNMISVDTPIITGSDLEPGATAEVEFKCDAAKCMDYEKESQMMLATKLTDEEGNKKDFTDGSGLPVNIVAAREPDELGTNSAIKTVGVYFLLAVLFGTLLFSIALVGSVLMVLFRDKLVSAFDRKKEGDMKEEEKVNDDVEEKKAEPMKEPAPPQQSAPPAQQMPQMQQTRTSQQMPQGQTPAQQAAPPRAQQPQANQPQQQYQKPPMQQNQPLPGGSNLDEIFS